MTMPAIVVHRGSVYRVIRSEDGKIVRHPSGKPVDNGGWKDHAEAVSQALKINSSMRKRDALTGTKPIHLALADSTRAMLPDSSFAIIEAGGSKDDTGRTVPRGLRKLPYLNASGGLVASEAHAALAALNGARGGENSPVGQKVLAWEKIVAALKAADGNYMPPHRNF